MFAAAGFLTYYIYPLHYPDLVAHDPWAIAALAGRNLLLIALTLIVAGSLRVAWDSDGSAPGWAVDRAGAA